MITKIFKDFLEFSKRKDKKVNGWSEEFMDANLLNLSQRDGGNIGCWNVAGTNCSDCSDCEGCTGCEKCVHCSLCEDCVGLVGRTGCTGVVACKE